MEQTYFITGYPGFIASKLVEAIQNKFPSSVFYLLILKSDRKLAEEKLASMQNNIHLIEGDITAEDLGIPLSVKKEITKNTNYILHLAALYDLTVDYAPAYACNVKGTEHMVKFAAECENIKRFCYFSTAYVSGNIKGKVSEDHLVEPPGFRNYYEQTKYEAEKLVRASLNTLPVTIIRPGIIVGDSNTGETVKFDGPYFMMQFLRRLSWLPIPFIGRSASIIHLVPVDFIVESTVYLMHDNCGESKTYHVLSPYSPRIQDAYSLICKELNGKKPSWFIPKKAAEQLLRIKIISKWLGVPLETLSYFSHEADYDTSQLVKDLKGTGISCPDFREFVKPIVRYYKLHADNKVYKRF